MTPIELAVISVVLLALYVGYKALTAQMALIARKRLLRLVRPIIHNEKYSDELRRASMALFCMSCSSGALPRIVWRSFFRKKRQRSGKGISGQVERRIFIELLVEAARVNVIAAPHWYALFGFLFALMVVIVGCVTLGRKTGVNKINSFEHSLASFSAQGSKREFIC